MASVGKVEFDAQVNTVLSPTIPVGVSTYLGIGLTVFASLIALYSAIQENDTATIASSTTALLTAISTIGSRGAQAVTAVKSAALIAAPAVDAIAEFNDHEVDEVPYESLPSDAVEFDQTPWDEIEHGQGEEA